MCLTFKETYVVAFNSIYGLVLTEKLAVKIHISLNNYIRMQK